MKVTYLQVRKVKSELVKQVKDFSKKIYPIYELLEWEWKIYNPGIPRIKDIELTLYDMISDLDTKYSVTSSGGLQVGYDIEGKDCIPYMKMEIEPDLKETI